MQFNTILLSRAALVFVFLLGLSVNGSSIAQEQAKELTQAEIQAQLAEIMKTLPADETSKLDTRDSSSDSSESGSEEYGEKPNLDESNESFEYNVVAELEAAIAGMPDRKLSREEGQRLLRLKLELKIAKIIAGQLGKTRLAGGSKSRAKKAAEDSFVITKIEVPAKSSTANVTFASMAGELDNTNDLFEYLRAAPEGSFRDYRIVSRHTDSSGAAASLETTRREYDLYKERERQMLAYIAARNKQLAAVKRSKRC